MSDALDRELEAETRALLRAAREPLPASAQMKARALRRLALALPIGGSGGGGEPGARALPARAAPRATSAIGRAIAARVPAWSLLTSFVAGGAIALVAARRDAAIAPALPGGSATTAVARAESTSSTAPIASPPPPAALVPSAEPSLRFSARASTTVAPTRAGAGGGLEAESALLDIARTALGRGDGSNALRATEQHARRFPRGILAEEREAMSIQALRLLHRDDEARARLGNFRERFPTSLILPALDAPSGGAP